VSAVGVLQSLIGAAACVLALTLLTVSARWVQVAVRWAAMLLGAWVVGRGVAELDGGAVLAGFLLIAVAWGLDAILLDIRRAQDAALSPSGQAPGGAHAPGEAGKRDGERHAPSLPSGLHTTAGCAGRPRSFSEVGR
jgi:hypothetical protein